MKLNKKDIMLLQVLVINAYRKALNKSTKKRLKDLFDKLDALMSLNDSII